jgi:hypothetical protein
MPSHRTTALVILLLALLGLLAGTAGAGPLAPGKRSPTGVPVFIFPVVGPVDYTDDWGESRGDHGHQGNDLLAPKRSPAVATEDGKIKFWTTSSLAGCMLYLYGDSGTTYLYIHLNNDVTLKNDNRGRCVAGTAYWKGIRDGQRVKAGQPIAYVGDSGDADGTPHLHFEVHPNDGGAVDPFPYLAKAQRMLFLAQLGSTVTLSLEATFVSIAPGQVKLRAKTLRVLPGKTELSNVGRNLVFTVPPDTLVQRLLPNGLSGGPTELSAARKGQSVTLLTLPVAASLDVMLARDGVLSASQILLR